MLVRSKVFVTRAAALLLPVFLLLLLSSIAHAAEEDEPAAAASRRPNVLFIAVDDLNDWTGALGGHPQAKTPHIDRLARRGVLFTRAYCSAPACNPSRASLLTGVRPSTSGVYNNNQPWRPALPDVETLPRWFRDQGYEVRGGGKIFHGPFPDPEAWDESLPRPEDPVPEKRPLNGIPKTAHFDWGPLDVPESAMGDRRVADWAASFLGRAHEKPFFLAVGFYRPHLPWYVPREWFKEFPASEVELPVVKPDDLADVPPAGRRIARPGGDHRKVVEHGEWRKAVSSYLASIRFADAMVGRVIDALDSSAHARNTIVVLWGDHGWHLGEKEHWRKFALWEEATRVPLIVVAPGVTPVGAKSERTVSLLDLYPTLVELAGLPAPGWLEGRSLVPLLRDPALSWDHPAVTTHGYRNHAIRSERYRYIRYADGSEELYDHDADPYEWTNLAARPESKPVIARLARALPETNTRSRSRRAQGTAGSGSGEDARSESDGTD